MLVRTVEEEGVAVIAKAITRLERQVVLDPTLIAILEAVYPVGVIFETIEAANPATQLGIGTWAAFGEGRVLVGLDSGDTAFDTPEETGGAKTHALSAAEMPAHTHTYTSPDAPVDELTVGAATAVVKARSTGTATGSAGSGDAHNNVQPYIVVYRWKRTA